METVVIAGNVMLSRVIYGTRRLAEDASHAPAHVQAKIEACLAQGVTSVETSSVYGRGAAALLLGDALRGAPGLRERIEIILKVGQITPDGPERARLRYSDCSPGTVTAAVDAALADLGTDRIDLLLLDGPDPLLAPELVGSALDGLVASGKIRAAGVAQFDADDIDLLQAAMRTPLAAAELKLSVMASAPLADGRVSALRTRKLRPIAADIFAGGRLFDDFSGVMRARLGFLAAPYGADFTVAAVAWLLRHPAGLLPVVDVNRLDRIRALGRASQIVIDAESWAELHAAGAPRRLY